MLASLGAQGVLMRDIVQRRFSGIADEQHIAAAPPVAPRGAPFGNVLLTAESDGSVAAVARHHLQLAFIDELHGRGA